MHLSFQEGRLTLNGLYHASDKNILDLPIIILNNYFFPPMSQLPFHKRVFLFCKHHKGR